MSFIGKNAVGLTITADMKTNISAATTTDFKVQKPDGDYDTWTGSIYGTDSIRYTTSSGDLDSGGIYKVQPYIVLGSFTGTGKTFTLTVSDDYK